VKLFWFIISLILAIVVGNASWIAPTFALLHRSAVTIDPNACGVTTNNWCVGSDGWTVFTASATSNSGTCNSSGTGTANGTCIVFVSSSLSGASDSTCTALRADQAGISTSNNLNGFSVPTAANVCQTLNKAQSLLRTNNPDWLAMKKGDVWQGGLNGTSSNSWAKNGLSVVAPMLITGYGTGARPQIAMNVAAGEIMHTQALNGQYLFLVGLDLYNQLGDPASPNSLNATFTADTTAGGTTLANINGGSGLPTQIIGSGSIFVVDGNGINHAVPSGTITAGATSLSLASGTTTFNATQMKVQIAFVQENNAIDLVGVTNLFGVEDTKFSYAGFSYSGNIAVAAQNVQFRIRRNIFNGSTIGSVGSITSPIFTGTSCPGLPQFNDGITNCNFATTSYILIEENVVQYGGWQPQFWAAYAFNQFHSWYFHNPTVAMTIRKNIDAHGGADNQFRGGTFVSNNLHLDNQGLNANTDFFTTSYTYEVNYNAKGVIQVRTANAANTGGSATLGVDGAIALANVNFVGLRPYDVSNPGAIPTGTSVSSISGSTSVTLSANIVAGVRGDGIQIGDTINFENSNSSPIGWQGSQGGTYVATTPTGSNTYPVGSTVAITSPGGVALLTDPTARPQDEPFTLTSGTVPTGIFLNTPYCSDPANGTSMAYPVYLADTSIFAAGACHGGSDLTSSGTGSAVRSGSRMFSFLGGAHQPSTANFPSGGIPGWVSFGMSVFVPGQTTFPQTISGKAGATTVQSISADRYTLVTADPSIATLAANVVQPFLFGSPGNINNPIQVVGPNNLYIRNTFSAGTSGGAIQSTTLANGYNGSGNYIYNWDNRGASFNIVDGGFSGTNIGFTSAAQVLNAGFPVGVSTGPDTRFPLASIEAYDASINGSGFNGTISSVSTYNPGSGVQYDKGTLTVNSGTPPNVGDMIFGIGVVPYVVVLKSLGAGQYLIWAQASTLTIAGPTAMTNGSEDHFLNLALSQSKDVGWNPVWTAAAANNYIRNAIKCGNQTTFPGSPACPAQNFLLKRDIDPASNDNDPMWLEKAA
jgi:hypothetical protein